ncbi:hypothetical protein J6590_040354 [Homalodisca vitripennis]|nr:hypothetical protein J6590_040354 [Homalodisca vitripennis]
MHPASFILTMPHCSRMVLILPEHSQRPYRYGMTLLCIGAMFNWLGLADNNAEPVRYIGVTLIAAGAMLICLAMCFWMKATHDPQVAALQKCRKADCSLRAGQGVRCTSLLTLLLTLNAPVDLNIGLPSTTSAK